MKNLHFDCYTQIFKKTFDFQGKTSPKEFWIAVLYNIIIGSMISFVISLPFITNATLFVNVMYSVDALYEVVLFLPMLALICRRLHDVGKSNWTLLWLLIPFVGEIVLFIYLSMPSNRPISFFPFVNFGRYTQQNPNQFDVNVQPDEHKDSDNSKKDDKVIDDDYYIDPKQYEYSDFDSESKVEDEVINITDDKITISESKPSKAEQIEDLQRLKDNGEITVEEYEQRVREILK